MTAKIYTMTHRVFEAPPDEMYVPVHVGRAAWTPAPGEEALLNYTGDDTGDNISAQNCYFSELTGMYWVWKNVRDADIVGICHYRRYLLNDEGRIFTETEIIDALEKYDIITTKNLQLNFPYREGFSHHHKPIYLDETERVIAEKYPEYSETFARLVQEKHTYFGNMMICKKELYDSYCEWLFSILFEVQRRVNVDEEDSYHRRIFGFISEFLQYVWIKKNNLKVCECMVGMLGEKAEVTDTKNKLAEFFARGDYEGAREFFLDARKRRPDIMMEASDVTGELHLCMEVIAIAGMEQQRYGTNILNKISDFGELMNYCSRINRLAAKRLDGEADAELEAWARGAGVTDVTMDAARAVAEAVRKK